MIMIMNLTQVKGWGGGEFKEILCCSDSWTASVESPSKILNLELNIHNVWSVINKIDPAS